MAQDKMPDMAFLAEMVPETTQLAKSTRGRYAEDNPMEAHFMSSANGTVKEYQGRNTDGHAVTRWIGEPKQLPIQASLAQYVERLLRRAAASNNMGVTVQFFLAQDSDEQISRTELPGYKEAEGVKKLHNNKKIWIAWAAKQRADKPRVKTDEVVVPDEDDNEDETDE